MGSGKRVLVACEESQAVTERFRNKGVEAYSCDLVECGGSMPQYHLQCDVTQILKMEWDCVIAFPPCDHLAVSGAAWFEQKRKDGRQQQGIDFFMMFAELDCPLVAIENPVGIMSTKWRKPDQIIQPYWFGDSFSKKTCLWLKGLPLLEPTNMVDRGEWVTYGSGRSCAKWYSDSFKLPPKERKKVRSRTFDGVADAMVNQWIDTINS